MDIDINQMKFIAITAARNEGNYIDKTLKSIVSQTVLPEEWIIVDDGSTDDTANIAEGFARSHPWIKVVRHEGKHHRNDNIRKTKIDRTIYTVDAFYCGLNQAITNEYDFIFLIDADVVLGPNYFKAILTKFAEDSRLGIASGSVLENIKGKMIQERLMPWGAPGNAKCWRRSCFREIGGLVRGPGWDSIDNFQAIIRGWQVNIFEDPELKVLHLRPAGSSETSILRGRIVAGHRAYFMGIHPLYYCVSALYHLPDYPCVLGSLCKIIGYLQGFLGRSAQYDDKDFIRYSRKWQLNKLYNILRFH
jgi:poly-beta-1,6-N-acetyl-D-glucosamine synthase